ncbi:MAG: hypothetical protein KF681_00585 [Bdellovibrionaceae bacterium]|nr:hypothetical protein [Pseudobdellovibrionaceae bacterium]
MTFSTTELDLKRHAVCLVVTLCLAVPAWGQQEESKSSTGATAETLGLDKIEPAAQLAQNMNPAGVQMQSSMELHGPGRKTWGLNLHSENWMSIRDEKELGSEAPLTSLNAIGLVYNVNEIWSVELRQYAEYASNVRHMGEEDQAKHQNQFEWDSLVLIVDADTGASLWGSKPIHTDLRYYAPTDRLSREAHQAGLLRSDTFTEWSLTPRWAIGGLLSARVQLNSADNPNQEKGSDAEDYRLNLSPSINYYWNDLFSAYYAYTLNLHSSEAQRGDWRVDEGGDVSWHDVGLYIGWGPVLFNPSIVSRVGHEDHQNSVFTGDARVFAHDNTTYNFNVYAEF